MPRITLLISEIDAAHKASKKRQYISHLFLGLNTQNLYFYFDNYYKIRNGLCVAKLIRSKIVRNNLSHVNIRPLHEEIAFSI